MSKTTLTGINGITVHRLQNSCNWVIDGHHIQAAGAPAFVPPDSGQPWTYDDNVSQDAYHWDVATQTWFLVGVGGGSADDDFRVQGSPAATFGAGTVNNGAWRNGPIIIGSDTPRSSNVALDIRPDAGNVQEAQVLFTGVFNSTPASPIEGAAATAFMWLPEAAALRAGRDTDTVSFSNANIGDYSFATGLNVRAAGEGSIAFGGTNSVQVNYSSITGGNNNIINNAAIQSIIGAGNNNQILESFSSIIGSGSGNIINVIAESRSNGILSGNINEILGDTVDSGIVAGNGNEITNGVASIIGAGTNNTLTDGDHAVIGGGSLNTLTDSVAAIIGGGQSNAITTANFAGVLSGVNNNVQAVASVIAGGSGNFIAAAIGDLGTIGGGTGNFLTNGAQYGSILGGRENEVRSLGGAIGGGRDNVIPVGFSYGAIPGGIEATSKNFGQLVMSSGQLTIPGDAQWSINNVKIETTDDTPTNMVINPALAATGVAIAGNQVYGVRGSVVARSGANDVSHWTIEATIKAAAGVAAIVGAPTITLQAQDAGAAAWAVVVVVTGGTFTVQVTGVVATTIHWCGSFHTTEVI